MAIDVISRSFYNQLENGDDFTLNPSNFTIHLQGNTQGRYKAIHEITVSWTAESSEASPFQFVASSNKITRESGDFVSDEFSIGDTISVSGTSSNNGDYTVTNVSTFEITVSSGITNEADVETAVIAGKTQLEGIEYKFGLIDNDEGINFLSKVDNQEQRYTVQGVGTGTSPSRDTSLITMNAAGLVKSWQTGNCKVAFVSETATSQTFRVEHEFVLIPVCLDGEQSNVNDLTPTDLFDSTKSLKYVFEFNAFHNISNPNSKHGGQSGQILGSTGWLNENFNGGINNYSLTSVSFVDKVSATSVDGVQIPDVTTVTAVIAGVNFDSSTKFVLNHQLLASEDQYSGTDAQDNTYDTNFVFETLLQTVGAASVDGDYIENLVAVLDSSIQITLTFDINFNAAQQDRLSTIREYLLSVLIQDHNLSVASSDQVCLKIDSQVYSKGQYGDDVPGLFDVENFKLYQHIEDDDVPTDGHTSIEAYVEDKVLSEFDFWLDLSLGAVIEKIEPVIVAYNSVTGESFDLQRESYDLSTYTISGGIQEITLSTTRGFLLKAGSDFNKVSIVKGSKIGDKQYYAMKWAFAYNWQDYVALLTADPSFYDNSKLNDGLNLNSSNYSEVGDWGIHMFIDAFVSDGTVTTTYRKRSPETPVFDYDTYTGTNPWSVTKQFLNQSDTDIGLTILNTEHTKLKYVFTNSVAPDVGSGFQGVFRIEEYQNGGLLRIHELSTWLSPAPNNLLIPLSGDAYARITKSPNNVLTLEAQIDKDLVVPGNQYQVTGRVFTALGTTYDFEDGVSYEFEDGVDYEFE